MKKRRTATCTVRADTITASPHIPPRLSAAAVAKRDATDPAPDGPLNLGKTRLCGSLVRAVRHSVFASPSLRKSRGNAGPAKSLVKKMDLYRPRGSGVQGFALALDIDQGLQAGQQVVLVHRLGNEVVGAGTEDRGEIGPLVLAGLDRHQQDGQGQIIQL